MFLEEAINENSVFGGSNIVLESQLQNPQASKQAIIYEALTHLSIDRLREFVGSDEAKVMLKKEVLAPEDLERLKDDHCNHHGCPDSCSDIGCCVAAKENDDPLWNELVQARMRERRIMNDLMTKYGELGKNMATDFINKNIPAYFRP